MLCRGIVSCSVGQCGNQVSEAFWRTIAEEHGVETSNGSCSGDDQMKERIGVYFNESSENTFLPRAALIDLEPGVLDNIRASDIGPLFRPDSFCNSTASAGNNWAKGHYTEGAELIEPSLDIIRREAETCDVLQGFQVTHSLGGGTGSGMGTLLVSKIREEYPDRILATYSVFPSPKVSNTVTEPYNATLSINQLVEYSDAVFAVDNEALHSICERNFRTPQPSYSELNSLISKVMAGVTCSLRFPGQLNSDMRKLCVNLVPFPRLHFFAVGYEPITMPDSSLYRAMSIAELAAAAFQGDNYMTDIDPRQGRFLTAATYFRGKNISTDEVDNELAKLQSKYTSQSVNWIPHNIKSSVCDQPPPGLAMSNAFVGNHTSINQMFRRISNQFRAMLNRKAYLHWYTGEGMDEMEFREADANLTDLQSEYCQCAETEEGGGESHGYGGEEE